jgi:hypothetical protein
VPQPIPTIVFDWFRYQNRELISLRVCGTYVSRDQARNTDRVAPALACQTRTIESLQKPITR